MASGQLQTILWHVHRLVGGQEAGEAPDRQLLDRFAAGRDPSALAVLVKRHGPLVWGVCWRALRHVQDAEDCFQATFLVLARKAASVAWRESVANWLYEVASRLAAETRTRNARRRAQERQVLVLPEKARGPESSPWELCAILDEELHRLPAKYRTPLLLCYLEGRTANQAARQLGWSVRTLERRLAQGRQRLRARLTRRGLTLSGVLLTAALSREAAQAAVPAGLATATLKAATSLMTELSPAVTALVESVSKGMPMTKLKLLTVVIVLLSATTGGGLLLGSVTPRTGETPSLSAPTAVDPPAPVRNPAARDRDATPPDLAHSAWAILELVRENHLKPPPRHELIVRAAQALLKTAQVKPPTDLADRAADVGSEQQLRTFVLAIWPRPGAAPMPPKAKLETAFLEGLCDGIPGESRLFSAEALKIEEQVSGNRYVGIGIMLAVNKEEKRPQIVLPFRRGTARKGGAKPGDLILEVDGKATQGVELEKVVGWLRGAEGTSVTIVVKQPAAATTRTLKLTRAVTPFDSVFGYRRASADSWNYLADPEARVAYVWLDSLKSSTLQELRQIERRLQADKVRALVLDFRFSEGEGHLHHAALVADGLLDSALMWRVRSTGDKVKEYRASGDCLFRGLPLAVLVNGIRDGAQGAVLGALQDTHRAVLVGEPAKGDGSVRTLFTLPDQQGGVTLLTGRLERTDPSHHWPVQPDYLVPVTDAQRAAVQKWLKDKQVPELPAGADDRPPPDPQLAKALDLLREALKKNSPPRAAAQAGGKG
jgi:C-terminal peptidase prc